MAALALPDVALFEFGVICEVFGIDRSADGVPPFRFRVCGPEAGVPLGASVGAAIVPEHGLDGLLGADLVAVAATGLRTFDEPVLAALRAAAASGATMLSVCSGAFVLGAAGLLDGRRCTAHWMHTDELCARHPLARVDPGVLFVDDGNVVTSAGTAAGIDACLHVVRRELGGAAVNAVARRMVIAPQRDGGQRQFVQQPVAERPMSGLGPVLDWAMAHLDVEHQVSDLARRAHMSDRTFARRFVAETGTTPHRWLTVQRVLLARRLLEDTELAVDAVATNSGFTSAALLRHHFVKAVGVGPTDYRRSFRTTVGSGS